MHMLLTKIDIFKTIGLYVTQFCLYERSKSKPEWYDKHRICF